MFPQYLHISLILSLGYLYLSAALPLEARRGKQKNTKTAAGAATKATDGSTIIDKKVVIKYEFGFSLISYMC